MPGFIVNGLGTGAPASVKPYYKYTWEVTNFYGDGIQTGDPLIYLIEAGTPSWDFDKEEVMGASVSYKFAKSIKWNDIKFTWYDTVGLHVKVKKWRQSIWRPDQGLQNPDDYKKLSTLKSLTFAWENPVVWTMFNSWPVSVKAGDLTYTESAIKQVEVTLSYDWAEENDQ